MIIIIIIIEFVQNQISLFCGKEMKMNKKLNYIFTLYKRGANVL